MLVSKRLCTFFDYDFLNVLFDMSIFENATFLWPYSRSIFLKKKKMRVYFSTYGTILHRHFLLAQSVCTLLLRRVIYVTFQFLVIDSDPMSKMSAIIRRIINTTNAPAAIGPYRWEFLQVRPKARKAARKWPKVNAFSLKKRWWAFKVLLIVFIRLWHRVL